jgi:ACS family hexuronate transporter-like MFS transporter
LLTSLTGVVWLAAWWFGYRRPHEHPGVNAAELAYIQGDEATEKDQPKIGWMEALRYRETWGFAAGKFFSDPVWWFYLYWLPPYLYDVRKFNLTEVGWALPVVYLAADFGSVFGGWISGWFMRRGMAVAPARKISMGASAALMPIAATCVLANESWVAIALVSLAAVGHQSWSANLFVVPPDVFPKGAVASVTGIGGCAGALGGILFSGAGAGWIIEHFGYPPAFLMMGGFHLTGFLLVHLLLRDFRPVAAPRA